MIIKATRMSKTITIPERSTDGAAGYDLRALDDHYVPANYRLLIPTGLSIAIPDGYVGMVCSRSGLAFKYGIFVLNAPGIIDSDYRGEVGVILANSTPMNFFVGHGDRIAQLVIVKHEKPVFEFVEDLDGTVRGDGGFGSTGAA